MAKPKRGGARYKGQAALYSEYKKNVVVTLTNTGVAGLDKLAEQYNLSRSELVEQIGRGKIIIAHVEEEPSSLREVQAC
ncbi:MAG: hypothetical protein ACM37W_25935 [Actinomycetota bacterium]